MSEQETSAATGSGESRRDAISAALDKATAAPDTTPETPAPVAATPSESPEPAKSERIRDEVGRFTKAEKAAQAQAATAKAPDAVVEAPKPSRKYPSSWKKDYEPTFRKLEASEEFKGVLDEIERRENDFHQGINKFQDDSKFAQNIRRIIAPFEATMRTLNVQPEQALAGLLASDHALRYGSPAQKAQAVQRLFQSYGIDPSQVFGGEQQAATDPNVAHLQQQLAAMQNQYQQLSSTIRERDYQIRERDYQAANAHIEEFGRDKPHFQEVRQAMAQLIQAGLAKTIQEAYDKAIYADPAIREKVLAEAQAKAEAERKAKAQAATAAAKSAAVQVTGSPPGSASAKSSAKPRDRRAAIAQIYDAAT